MIVPVHGEAKFLAEAIRSIYEQRTQEAFEVVFVLDRASSQAIQTIEHMLDANARVVRSKVPGIAHAHNSGLRSAKFDLVAIMHSDDIMAPDRLEIQSQILRKQPDLVCVGGQVELTNSHGDHLSRVCLPRGKKECRFTMKHYCCLFHPTVMYRKNVALRVGGYDQRYVPAEDYHLWLRMLQHGEIRNTNHVLLRYRIHEKQTSQQEAHAHTKMKTKILFEYKWRNRNRTKQRMPGLLSYRRSLAFSRLFEELTLKRNQRLHLLSMIRYISLVFLRPISVTLLLKKHVCQKFANRSLVYKKAHKNER